ncbi:putative ser/thr protein phosphatase [Trypanosoma cruzi]|uniref:Serine/threonine-protein phosphatase n=2 Tax=Trypanosoma cruzi TaxID=5693 RepID=Q4E2P1_TRYCC|nr:serine/threonine protein phosphatase, putative [Trypanosoma cruzi]EAN99022.1 serine/threonine protein phosphatase, putative [Trypanosoma cruzi]PWV12571.1 putative ser/thr protein phosphatase [Trypanosoma cruzi]|eukprot:XP_820873.1 serine/threonine protein phosphatase [Trypanosoma cruzi strain CL Brener]
MGCTNTKESSERGGGNASELGKGGRVGLTGVLAANGLHGGGSANDQVHWPTCHFCGKRIPEKEYNAHTVMCDEREVTCWNSWCRQIVKQGMLHNHLEECAKKQRALCYKCGADLLATELQAHRDGCQPQKCTSCGELCITRIMKWCPDNFITRVPIMHGPFATEVLLARYVKGGAQNKSGGAAPVALVSYNVARMQLLWRWTKAKSYLEEAIFRLTSKEMNLKKEGFAIFKALDKVSDSHVLEPRRSRSILQTPVVAPAISSHYFPTRMAEPITIEVVQRLINDLTDHVLLPYPAAWRVFTDAMSHLNTMPNVVRLSPPVGARVSNGRINQGSKVVVVGDLHGQLADLLHILKECGMPNEGTYYIFNGDFVDRGANGVEVLLILFSLMLACPKYVTLNRGNHECDYMNDEYGFDVEVSTKYDRNVFRLVQRCFCALPLATIIGKKVFVVHGGLPRRKGVNIEDISRIQRFRQIPMPDYSQPEEDEIFQDLLWSDPVEDLQGWRESPRGAGVVFGADVTQEFLQNNGLELVIRSHEECLRGYEEHHDGKLLTVFSASNYDGPETNFGSFAVFVGDNPEPSFHTYQVAEDDVEVQTLVDLGETFTPTLGRVSSFATLSQSKLLLRRRARDDVLRVLRERIYQRRHRLLAYFAKLDRTRKGSVWKIEWVEAMRNVLNLDLPWFFLRGYLVADDENTRVWYSHFLVKFHNFFQPLWLNDWIQSACYHLTQQQRANHRSQYVAKAFNKEQVSYNEFCSVIRAIDYTMSEAQLFQLFVYLDEGGTGHIDGPKFVNMLSEMAAYPLSDTLRWDLGAMEQLQSVVIQGRSQLPYLFKVTSKDRALPKEKFMLGLAQLGRGMRKQLTQQQKEKIYEFLAERAPPSGVMFEHFLFMTAVFDVQAMPRSPAVVLADVNLFGNYLKNSSFSSMCK